MLDIAILGGSHKIEGMIWRQVYELAEENSRKGYSITTAGSGGVAKAVAKSIRNITGIPKEDESRILSVYTDFSEDMEFFNAESHVGSYHENLAKLHKMPDVWIFFPGHQGTIMQLFGLLHLVRKREIKMDYRRIILVGENGCKLKTEAQHFYQDVADSTTGVIPFPWTLVESNLHINVMIDNLSIDLIDYILSRFRECQDEVSNTRDLVNLLSGRMVNSHTAERVINYLIETKQLCFTKAS